MRTMRCHGRECAPPACGRNGRNARLLLGGAILALSGCELFGLDQATPISVPEITREFSFDLGAAFQGVSLPAGDAEVPVNLWFPQDVALTDYQPDLARYRGKVESIEIEYITYRIGQNTVTQDIGPLALHFGQVGKRAPGPGVAKYGETGVVRAGQTTPGHVAVQEEPPPGGAEAVGPYLGNFDFSVILGTDRVHVRGGAAPSGRMSGEVRVKLTVFVKPLD